MLGNGASVYAKIYQRRLVWMRMERMEKSTRQKKNQNCQTDPASAGQPGYNWGCSNLWENVLRREDMSAAPIKTIITESSPSPPSREAERERKPSGGEGKVRPGCKATPAKLVDSQISTKTFIYFSWRSGSLLDSRLFLMCIYWNFGPWTLTASCPESDWDRLTLWSLCYSRATSVFGSRIVGWDDGAGEDILIALSIFFFFFYSKWTHNLQNEHHAVLTKTPKKRLRP